MTTLYCLCFNRRMQSAVFSLIFELYGASPKGGVLCARLRIHHTTSYTKKDAYRRRFVLVELVAVRTARIALHQKLCNRFWPVAAKHFKVLSKAFAVRKLFGGFRFLMDAMQHQRLQNIDERAFLPGEPAPRIPVKVARHCFAESKIRKTLSVDTYRRAADRTANG